MIKGATQRIQALQKKIYLDLRIDDTRLSHELKDQSSKFSYWAAASALKTQEYQLKKKELVDQEAGISRTTEYRLIKEKEKNPRVRITDKVIRDYVIQDQDYQRLQEELINLGLENDILAGAKESFRQRAQLLLEMARIERHELTTPEAVYTKKLMKEYEVTNGK